MIRLILAIGILIGYISGLGFIYLGVVAATIGFWLTMVGLLLIWAFVLYTGFLFLEVCAAQPLGADIPSITKKYLGGTGGIVSNVVFLFLHYGYLTIHYILGASVIFGSLGLDLPLYQMYLILFILLSVAVFLGLLFSAGINFLFVAGLLISMLALYLKRHFILEHDILFKNWIYLYLGVSVIYDFLFFQSAVPTVFSLLKGNWKKAKMALWIGTLVPLILHCLWLWLFVDPKADIGLIQAFENYNPIINDLKRFHSEFLWGVGIDFIIICGTCAGTLSTAIVFFHFFSDLLKSYEVKADWHKRMGISVLIAFPPVILALMPHPMIHKIINSLEGFEEVFLGAAIPIFCLLVMRYIQKEPTANRIPCRLSVLIFLVILTVFFFYIEGVSILNIIIW